MGVLDFFSPPDQSDLSDPKKNPVGRASELTSLLTRTLGGRVEGQFEPGFASASEVLGREGKTKSRAGEFARRKAETMRQRNLQDVSQQSALGGLEGTAGAQAISGLAEAAGARGKAVAAQETAFAERERQSQDVAGILQDLFTGTGLQLAAGAIPAQEDTRPTGLKNILGAGGDALGAYMALQSGGLLGKG